MNLIARSKPIITSISFSNLRLRQTRIKRPRELRIGKLERILIMEQEMILTNRIGRVISQAG